jgi:hypothetical protein
MHTIIATSQPNARVKDRKRNDQLRQDKAPHVSDGLSGQAAVVHVNCQTGRQRSAVANKTCSSCSGGIGGMEVAAAAVVVVVVVMISSRSGMRK